MTSIGLHTKPAARVRAVSVPALWVGRVLSTLAVAFLAFDAVIKLLVVRPVVETFGQLGYPVHLAVAIGVLELACLAVYLVPRTAVVGAVLLTGY